MLDWIPSKELAAGSRLRNERALQNSQLLALT
jgi:hypothetical protein